MNEKLTMEELEEALALLPRREQIVIKAHFGLEGPRLTYAEIARRYNISSPRARQIVSQGFSRIRQWYILKQGQEYIDDFSR